MVESLMAEDVEEIDPPHKIEKNNVVVDKLGAKSISELTSIEHGREGHDTWRTKSLIRPDSFSGEFIQEMEAGDEALRQQRVSAALENMQVMFIQHIASFSVSFHDAIYHVIVGTRCPSTTHSVGNGD